MIHNKFILGIESGYLNKKKDNFKLSLSSYTFIVKTLNVASTKPSYVKATAVLTFGICLHL